MEKEVVRGTRKSYKEKKRRCGRRGSIDEREKQMGRK